MQDGPRKGAILVSGGALRAGKLLRLGRYAGLQALV